MPILYDYKCKSCSHKFEELLNLSDYQKPQKCPWCGSPAEKIIEPGHGGIFCDNSPSWISDANEVLQMPGEPPITTRTEHKQVLKKYGLVERGTNHTDKHREI